MTLTNKTGASPDKDRPSSSQGGNFDAIVADIGGTNARFACVTAAGEVGHVQTLLVADYRNVVEATRTYLASLAPGRMSTGADVPGRQAVFAVAAPVAGDEVRLTNGPWTFSRRNVMAELGFKTLRVINDFEALALSLPRLSPHQIRPWGAAPTPMGMLAVVGAGTGLGVAGVLQTADGWHAVSGEGGHTTLPASDAFERELLNHAGGDGAHVSAEALLSGTGLPRLHRAVAATLGVAVDALTSEHIIERGLSGADVVCSRVLDAFCALLGGFSGNVALTLGARGGVYIGGGIVPRLGERFFQSAFRERFEAKGRYGDYLRAVPTALITDTWVALTGAAYALNQPVTRNS